MTWLAGFRSAIAGYKYYTDFDKIYRNVNAIRVELNIMNSLIAHCIFSICNKEIFKGANF